MDSHTLNPGIAFDPVHLSVNFILENEVKKQAGQIISSRVGLVKGESAAAWLLKAVTCIDLTTLAGDDTEANVLRLCHKALNPIRKDILMKLNLEILLTCGAVCVYPARVEDAYNTLQTAKSDLPVASVATGFPAGQTTLRTKLVEIEDAVAAGASEIDVVISRRHAIIGDWETLYDELKQMRKACGKAHMKTILAVGELSTFKDVYIASMVAMMAGSDFIKTSTGKESVNATLPVGLIMCLAIKDYQKVTGYKVGLKPAGGLRTCQDAINWLILVKECLGNEWLNPTLFRIGASGLLSDIEKELYKFAYGHPPKSNTLPIA
ncbi:Deoxyribose-phosphate aldolase [Orchesella cincta]|uniref:deoxyribose-phosphate aldolase n=1 Tax=Orchesella cincta TaxID=48709 RepID=A0A1D2NIC6_ORCCI|nr:Deoxyribose-phosphate aldolase [Orchesella cincta]